MDETLVNIRRHVKGPAAGCIWRVSSQSVGRIYKNLPESIAVEDDLLFLAPPPLPPFVPLVPPRCRVVLRWEEFYHLFIAVLWKMVF